MPSNKNTSPQQIALLIASILSAILLCMFFFINTSILIASLLTAIFFCCSYYITLSFITSYIQRKIKLIYKLIAQTKATSREEFYMQEILKPKTLDEADKDVQAWIIEHNKQLDHLESNENFRKEFLMNLAHELKTPVFSIQGYIDTLLDGAMHDSQMLEKFLTNASKSTERLTNLIADVDTITKLEIKELPIYKQPFCIQELVIEVFNELQQRADKQHIILKIKQGCESPIQVHADKEKIKQVLSNIVENSLKYGKHSGGITTAGVYAMDNNTCLVEITDNGIGISEENLPRVFERFYRTDEARSRKEGGSGLGLAIAKHIIEAHGQSIQCRSTVDVGTSFSFTLVLATKN